MSGQSYEKLLNQVTEEILTQMQLVGWYFGSSREPRYERPTPWHINTGWCEEWALLAKERVGGEDVDVDAIMGTDEEYAHVVLKLNGRYYDSQHPNGVNHLKDLDVVRRRSLSDFLNQK